MDRDSFLVWIDLEMTGLNPDRDVILEIATIVTDNDLVIIEEGPSFVINQPPQALSGMDTWVKDVHTKSGLVQEVNDSTVTVREAQEKTLSFLKKICKPGTAPLCGNSVWQDRAFLVRGMPEIVKFLHYRIIDVSSIKEVVNRWYPSDEHAFYKKKAGHRALDDIRESINELRNYRRYFFV